MQPREGSASWLSLPAFLPHPISSLQHLGTALDAMGTKDREVIHNTAAGGGCCSAPFQDSSFPPIWHGF